MKVILKIFIPLCVVSFIAFGISVAVFGVNKNAGYGVGSNQSSSYQIDGEYTGIEANIGSYELVLSPHSGSKTEVNITGSDADIRKVNVGLNGDTLVISTSSYGGIDFSSWINWIMNRGRNTTVNVSVPDKVYERLTIGMTSGYAESVGVSAKNVELSTTSGHLKYLQPDITTDSLTIKTTSGSITALNAATKSYDIRATSGDINVSSLTGTGNIRVSSSVLQIGFKELTGDCYVNMTSGDVALGLPWDTSANIHCSKTSGDVVMTTFDGTETNSVAVESGDIVLGSGGNKINVTLTSGDIELIRARNEDYFDSSYEYYFDESAHAETTSIYPGTAHEGIAAVEEITNAAGDNIDSAASVIEANIESAASIVEENIDRAFNYIN